MINKTMGIYIHIPFCVKKCNYCDFLSFPADEASKSAYMAALLKEIELYGTLYGTNGTLGRRDITTVFFGGGTPSILESRYIASVMDCLHRYFNFSDDAEITIECNPGTLTLIKLADYKCAGINRLSLGLQSACDAELAALGRIHSYASFAESFRNARRAGFDNINIDIMSALPGQSLSSYINTLNSVIGLAPEHISAYSLIIEEGTPFYDIYADFDNACGYLPLPDEDTEREMYYKTDELLSAHGYHRYEISNYTVPHRECRHNLGYWHRTEYLGLGLGSSSFISNVRFKNITDLKQYIDILNSRTAELSALTAERLTLSVEDAMAEFMYLGLRTADGIRKSEFARSFGRDITSVYGKQLEKFTSEMLLYESGDIIRLTKKGIDLSNYVFADFLI